MKNSSETDLAPIWADATPLSDYLERKTRPPIFVTDQNSGGDGSSVSSAVLGLAAAFQAIGSTSMRMEEAKKNATNDLIAGRLSAIGRKEHSKKFEVLEGSHWIGSEIHWHGNGMTRGRVTYVDIRIVEQEQADDTELENEAEYRDTADVVKAAILQYATEDPTLSAKPEIRYRAYREFIRESGFDPHYDRGFSEKTFEAYESKFRKKNKAD